MDRVIEAACPNCGWRQLAETDRAAREAATLHNQSCLAQRPRPVFERRYYREMREES